MNAKDILLSLFVMELTILNDEWQRVSGEGHGKAVFYFEAIWYLAGKLSMPLEEAKGMCEKFAGDEELNFFTDRFQESALDFIKLGQPEQLKRYFELFLVAFPDRKDEVVEFMYSTSVPRWFPIERYAEIYKSYDPDDLVTRMVEWGFDVAQIEAMNGKKAKFDVNDVLEMCNTFPEDADAIVERAAPDGDECYAYGFDHHEHLQALEAKLPESQLLKVCEVVAKTKGLDLVYSGRGPRYEVPQAHFTIFGLAKSIRFCAHFNPAFATDLPILYEMLGCDNVMEEAYCLTSLMEMGVYPAEGCHVARRFQMRYMRPVLVQRFRFFLELLVVRAGIPLHFFCQCLWPHLQPNAEWVMDHLDFTLPL